MAIETLNPNAAGDETEFGGTINPDVAHYLNIDDHKLLPDDDNTYISSTPDEGTLAYYIVIKENSTTTNVDKTSGTSTSYANHSNKWTTKPSDSGAFTSSDIDGLQIGVRFTGDDNPRDETDLFNLPAWPNSSGDTINSITVYARWKKVAGGGGSFSMRVTQVYVDVDYTAGGYSNKVSGVSTNEVIGVSVDEVIGI